MSLRTLTRTSLNCVPRIPAARSMPLRANITNPAWMSGSRKYATPTADLLKAQEDDDPDDVIFTNNYGVRSIELNRPKKLNSLNGSMARKIIPRLQEWAKSELAGVVIIKGNGRAFCAGGDVAALAKWNQQGPKGQQRSSDYFGLEYKLDHMIATYKKPYVAFMDGITMGGGVGLSIHAPFRIATENTLFAMPETTIGFFPDVGASFFLPRMEGALGTYLALTSEQLKGVDAFYHGVATHYIHSSTLQQLEARLAELQFPDYMSLNERFKIINATIEEFSTGLPAERPQISGELRRTIDSVFHVDQPNIKTIMESLNQVQCEATNPEIQKWADKTFQTINSRSPISVAVTLLQMRVGRQWSIAQAFQKEYAIASQFMAHPDFVEGVTARLIERKKERPNWKPNTIEEVKQKDVDAFFANSHNAPLPLITQDDYQEYPHAWIGLPREEEILREAGSNKSEEVVARLLEKYEGKQGVREKIAEVLERHQR
ncbi:CaiD Enoyl-CoA hydratase carnithine racemase [Pyrenophora tritici-repentis]|uniref:3-hydroxyisobutyryl-CoA hydrolase n=2 Tax=Pyrenophora tritici-repentis TaxID=45151 RepID=A0A2W1CZQ3_9PLEO|nr:3-hydroxyisobutyryl-CoA hydrolase, mitochondrial precursor [Pyrenophora tritici-repentis Pt-1C-BFP]KAF7570469.1 CaiD, Enoyl-CoA hydratase/carnithine racemase [Pyrenophora tritici-repentis]EDU48782.1 3-hydroxyisobutyryl-CoA hydrolase, mitochondrial precursor [Pyrenophora tritici-repentis Pt-1C-BFP]KAI0570594.1 mitochondrial 3-hydroxyisobutyryl-hydrolase [Pyrenophora tritici-repentis]KAI1507619.1 mitochondrial 3-hydroxyisobutyryl-hydrolase [Pyrenophora tritici-repentis]KAI1525070.1 CaiD Enoyl